MTAFNIDLNTGRPDRIFVEVDRRFDVAIERTPIGLTLRIYPRTDGELWCEPFTTFEVDEAEIITQEQEDDRERDANRGITHQMIEEILAKRKAQHSD